MRKAQISLEMIIMLVVLLVLAGVIISLILHFLRPGMITPPKEVLEKRDFLESCERLCAEKNIEFCQQYWNGNDWNENDIESEIIQVGEYKWYACEDRVYCFLVTDCKDWLGSGKAAIEKCRDLLCQTFIEKYEDGSIAAKALIDTISFSAKCTADEFHEFLKDKKEENWHLTFNIESC